ncbi:3-deoxy-7-phosphoheptulonate synthase [Streptomyces afghaniensis]|uniref:3-deoxy-7-phosphoheptulonate synthase n=1 Tax=Streptomyces afghaniensis TaxID=66865 RepID=UPI002783B951|nr:3-deoxy-7-phosphoheptulonate synthase [Streptomyces afghaniensis]MDQ1017855.1 3-deoxy-7-phosphoheptulonate synthase [Streptomyces afghaniensis]
MSGLAGLRSPRPALQQPQWNSQESLSAVRAELGERDPLADCSVHRRLHDQLTEVARGEGFVLQAGDCAETFSDSGSDRVMAKAAQLDDLSQLFENIAGLPAVRIGRLAGQYAKPRSELMETLPDGRAVPVYRGDAVNGTEPTLESRAADPKRLLAAYEHARTALRTLDDEVGDGRPYTSHEALLLDYEEPLTRVCACHGETYASSAPFLWIGDRTRQPGGAHIAWADSIANPVGVKVGKAADHGEIAEIVDRLTARRPAGRLSLIVRMGADRIGHHLPQLLERFGDRVIWICDPMHGNTIKRATGQKARLLPAVLEEIEHFVRILFAAGLRPGGLHLEVTPAAVDECVEFPSELCSPAMRFRSACDPRLNVAQAQQVVGTAAKLLSAG